MTAEGAYETKRLYTLLDSGVRISELIELDVGDIDFAAGELNVRAGRGRIVQLPTRTTPKIAWSLGERGLLELPEEGEIVLPASGGWPPAERVEIPDLNRIPALRAVPMSPMPFGTHKPPAEWPLFAGERVTPKRKWCSTRCPKTCDLCSGRCHPTAGLWHAFAYGFWARTQDQVALAEALGLESIESVRMYAQQSTPKTEINNTIDVAFG